MIPIDFSLIIFKENNAFVAYCPELDISNFGNSIDEARESLKTAVRLFLEESEKMGTLFDILKETGYTKDKTGRWLPPKMVATELVSLG
jgi:predicted RNase H-like HicB family nuclease